jgi:hypothetical protein
MSVAAFLKKHGSSLLSRDKGCAGTHNPPEPLSAGTPLAAHHEAADLSRVSLDGVHGTFAYVDGDRVVWMDDEGCVHLTLKRFLK